MAKADRDQESKTERFHLMKFWRAETAIVKGLRKVIENCAMLPALDKVDLQE